MLKYCGIIWQTFLYQFKRHLMTGKTVSVAVVMGIWLNYLLRPVATFCYQTGYRVFPWFFPFISSDYIGQMFITTGGVFLLADAQMSEQNRMYMQYRTGRFCWKYAGVLYLAIASLLYVLTICVLGWLNLFDVLAWGTSWGKIWGTLVQTSAATEYNITFELPYEIMTFPAIKATLYAILLEWQCIFFLGMTIYFLNDLTKRRIGCIAAGGYIFMDIWLYNVNALWLSKYSPVTMAQLRYYNGDYARYGLTLQYAFSFFGVACAGMIILILFSAGRKVRYHRKRSD